MMNTRPLILVVNDDGIVAPGIRALVEVCRPFGDLLVVAPDSPQSGQGHAVTLDDPLRIEPVNLFDGVEAYECSGTPVDCVKLARYLLKGRRPDLCVSGINHGSNASVNILYSGTLSAAMEASLEGIPSIGFSHTAYFSFHTDFTAAQHYARLIVEAVLQQGMPPATRLLNVNIPDLPLADIKGIKVCRQAHGVWVERYTEATDPRGRKYYWLSGDFVSDDTDTENDLHALREGFVSVVPCMHDLTAYQALSALQHLNRLR